MSVLGPDILEHGVNPDTAIIASGDVAMLGPATGVVPFPDPVTRIFVVLGKIIAARRILTSDQITPQHPAAIEQFGAVQEVLLDLDAGEEMKLIWKPLADSVEAQVVRPLSRFRNDLDHRTRRFIASETGTVLGIDPRFSVEQRMESLDSYLRMRGLTLEASSGGFRDFIARFFTDNDGNRVNLSTSSNPSFPDSWITPTPVDVTGFGTRTWNILW